MTNPWHKKKDGSTTWLEHISGAWRIAATRHRGDYKFSLWQKVSGKKYWRCYGVYPTSEDAQSAHKFQAPNRLTA